MGRPDAARRIAVSSPMFFVARSAVCIALVVGALPNQPTGTGATNAALLSPAVSRGGVAVLDALCRDQPARCVAVLASLGQPSRDTLLEGDRKPRWAGPAILEP